MAHGSAVCGCDNSPKCVAAAPTAKFEWPQWVPATRPNIILQEDYSTENSIDLCNFWDSVGYNF